MLTLKSCSGICFCSCCLRSIAPALPVMGSLSKGSCCKYSEAYSKNCHKLVTSENNHKTYKNKIPTKLGCISAGIQSKLRSFSVLLFSSIVASWLVRISSSLHFKFKAKQYQQVKRGIVIYVINYEVHTNFLDSFAASEIFTE